jgi:hypothetical protein
MAAEQTYKKSLCPPLIKGMENGPTGGEIVKWMNGKMVETMPKWNKYCICNGKLRGNVMDIYGWGGIFLATQRTMLFVTLEVTKRKVPMPECPMPASRLTFGEKQQKFGTHRMDQKIPGWKWRFFLLQSFCADYSTIL